MHEDLPASVERLFGTPRGRHGPEFYRLYNHPGWKYVCTPHNDWLLYDTADDPYEQANLVYWYDHQEAKQRCHRRLARWIAETGDAFELPGIDLAGAAGCWPAE